jgi:hypothetical protein
MNQTTRPSVSADLLAGNARPAGREETRRSLHIYMSRSGLTLPQLAERIGYSVYSLRQFVSGARYGDSNGHVAAEVIQKWMAENPFPVPESPGKLYETTATRQIDNLLAHVCTGGWGILYGPSGAQKSFLLEYRGAQAAREFEPPLVYLRSSPSGMTASVLLHRLAAALGAPYAQSTEAIRQSVLYALRRRRTSVALVMDEADALYRWVETLETLREIGDLARVRPAEAGRPARAGLGILVAGNERVMQIFENRRGVYFEKWRGRIQQEELRVVGPSSAEARAMVAGELGELKETTAADIVEKCTVDDPVTHRHYVNAHRLFNAIRDFREARAKRKAN